MGDTKKIAVIVRDRQGEALRVSGGLTLADDSVEVFVLGGPIDRKDPAVTQSLELANDLELKVCSTSADNGFPVITLEEAAKKLLEYDIVVPY